MTDRAAVKENYNRLSDRYDALAGKYEERYTDEGLALLSPLSGENILEIGFGTGTSLLKLVRSVGEKGTVDGIELSDRMVQVAREKVKKSGVQDRIELFLGDAFSMPFPADTYDALFASFVLDIFEFEEIIQILGECRRVLKENGRISAVSLYDPGKFHVAVSLYKAVGRLFPKTLDCRPIPLDEYISEAGFSIEKTKRFSMWGIPVEAVLAS